MTSFRSFTRCYSTVKNHRTKYLPSTKQKRWKGWMSGSGTNAICTLGSFLFSPTGGRKTFATVRFLCTSPLSKSYKVLQLGHTHHLLEQAFHTFESEVKHISLPQTRLDVRVVSGTPRHYSIDEIKKTDNVLLATLQTLTRAYKRKQPKLKAFFQSGNDKLFVVFD